MYRSLAAIIVTFNPEIDGLTRLIDLIRDQVGRVFIIDNGSGNSILPYVNKDCELIELDENFGIAKAQNIGLLKAINNGYTDFIFFDQDSMPETRMIEKMLMMRKLAEESGINIAAVGPLHIDKCNGKECTYIDTSTDKLRKIIPSKLKALGVNFTQCDFLIASGCLFSKKSLELVGFMEDELFIDCVDIEWGYRALDLGLSCVATFDAIMHHKIGDDSLHIFGRKLTTHSPIRHYYFYRNFYALLKRSYIPSCWKRHTLVKSSIQAVIFSLFLHPRFEQFKYIVKGVFHGVIGKNGKFK